MRSKAFITRGQNSFQYFIYTYIYYYCLAQKNLIDFVNVSFLSENGVSAFSFLFP